MPATAGVIPITSRLSYQISGPKASTVVTVLPGPATSNGNTVTCQTESTAASEHVHNTSSQRGRTATTKENATTAQQDISGPATHKKRVLEQVCKKAKISKATVNSSVGAVGRFRLFRDIPESNAFRVGKTSVHH